MTVRIINIENPAQAAAHMAGIGVDPAGIRIMTDKTVSCAVKLHKIKPVAANIIKQEMLADGGEAATAYGSINQSVETTDVLLFGTLQQLTSLTQKMRIHQFGLPQLAQEIEAALRNYLNEPAPLKIKEHVLDFKSKTYLMGILNVTPDSFSDGGHYTNVALAVEHAKQMLAEGADIIDIGGESTRPGATPVSVEEEKKRVLPVIEKLAQETSAIISIDTTKAEVAEAALCSGAVMVNDVSGLRADPSLAAVVAQNKALLCLMHRQGTPETMQQNPAYNDLLREILDYLQEGLAIAKRAGILLEKIVLDPGIGFGKKLEHNLEILQRLKELKVLGCPILVGPSRKAFIGQILGSEVNQRIEGTAAAVVCSIAGGANIVRVHEVGYMAKVVKIADAIFRRRQENGKENSEKK